MARCTVPTVVCTDRTMNPYVADIFAALRERQAEDRERKAAYMREFRKTHPPTIMQSYKHQVRNIARSARRRGVIEVQPCASCGSPDAEMHHEDYGRPLDVTWLCTACHRAHHHALRIGD